MLIDTHAHLTDNRFDSDRPQAIERAVDSGVTRIIEIACEPGIWAKALALAGANTGIYCALGIHPQEAKLCTETVFKELETLATGPKVVAIGETGFDYHFEYSPRDTQKAVFLKHLELSLRVAKPLVIHCREAYPDLIAALKGSNALGVIHCFSGTVIEAELLLGMGFYLGIDGPLTYPKSEALREAVRIAPLERLLLETDSPYLPPQQFRGKRNEPSYLKYTAEEVARVKGIDAESVARATSKNARTLFGENL